MANPTPDYPAAIHTPIDISAKASSALGSTPQKHSQVHGKVEEEIVEVQKKLGTGGSDASSASTGQVLTKKADGSTQWTTPSGGGGGGAVDSVNGQTGTVVLDTDDISDSAQTNKYVTEADKTNLSNLSGTNTGDQDLSPYQLLSEKGNPDGYAELDSGGLVPSSQLPSYVDDVLSYANLAAFPATGSTGKIYIAEDTNVTYRWSGSAYVEISASLALGETSSTAYRGDRGKTAYDHSQSTGNPHGATQDDIGDGTTYKQYSATEKTKLAAIEAGADVTDAGNVGSSIDGSSAKTTPVDADTMPLIDSAASNVLKKVTWANIKATLKTYFDSLYRSLARVTFSNADYTITATKDSVIAQIGTMSASRIVTLPAANSVPAGTEFMIMDSSGSVTPTNTIVITRAGSDTINGGTTETISSEYSWRRLVSDGTSKWSIDAGIVRQSQFNASLRAPQIMKNARYKTPATQPVAATTSALTAGRCYFHCFGIPSSGITTLTDFFFEVTTGWAGNTRVGLFKITDGKDPENGVTLIADLGNVDLTAAAQKYVSGLSQVCSEEWLIIGLYVHNATPVFRVMNTTGNAGTAAFQQTGYHSDATYTQYRPITGYYITGVDYSAGMPSSTGALSVIAGGTNASPLIAAKFSY